MICNVAILSRFSRVNGGKIDMLYSVKKDVDNPISPPCFFKKRFSKQLRRIRWRKFETRFDKYRGTDTKTPFRYYPELDNLLFLCIPSFSSVAVTVKSVCVCVYVCMFLRIAGRASYICSTLFIPLLLLSLMSTTAVRARRGTANTLYCRKAALTLFEIFLCLFFSFSFWLLDLQLKRFLPSFDAASAASAGRRSW